ncbi:MAG: alpha/beta fold hydrolase [Nanoarchaeota archaeon]
MKIFIKNRKDQKVCVVIDEIKNPKGLAFIIHGLGSNKDRPSITAIAKVLNECNYNVIRFDTTNTFGESDGSIEDATITNYYEDLEDVITWASSNSWYKEPFILVGYSLGGICITLYAEKYPEKVKALAPLSTIISGKLSFQTKSKEEFEEWKTKGWKYHANSSNPEIKKKLKWSHMEDRLKYDVLPNANRLKMPVLMIVGDKDTSTPLNQQKVLYEKLTGKKEIHIIKGAPHSFKEEEHIKERNEIFKSWIKKIK